MKAVIMAGGFGSRLYPLTASTPKPMIPFVNKPVLAHVLDLLKHHQICEAVITVRYLANKIWDYFGDGRSLGLKIHYALEETPLGTAGGVKNAQPYLDDETFLVISGDTITNIDLSALIRFHRRKHALFTMALKQVNNPQQYGLVSTDQQGRIINYQEKPDDQALTTGTINTGTYVMEPAVLATMQPNLAYDFSYDIFPRLLADNQPIFGYQCDGYWCDIGTMQTYRQAVQDALNGKIPGLILPSPHSAPHPMTKKTTRRLIEPEALPLAPAFLDPVRQLTLGQEPTSYQPASGNQGD